MTTTTLTTSTVRFALDAPGLSGLSLLTGEWRFTPSRRLVAVDHIIAPATIAITPTPADVSAGYFIIDLASTDTGDYGATAWAWVVKEPRPGITRAVFVPMSTATLEYAGLASIDPVTLAPLAEPEPAWTASLDQTNAAVAELSTEYAGLDESVGDLADQTLTRLNAKLDTATYTAFHGVVVDTLGLYLAEITALQAQTASLLTGIDGGLILASSLTDAGNGTAAAAGAIDAGDGTASLTGTGPGDGTLTS